MQKKLADRSEIERIIDSDHTFIELTDNEFKGYISLVTINEVSDDLIVISDGENIQLLGKDFKMLQYIPYDSKFCLTVFFTPRKKVIEWYYDIITESGLNQDGIPFFVDIYLDVIVVPGKAGILVDEDELVDALNEGLITIDDYSEAYKTANMLLNHIDKHGPHFKDRVHEDLELLLVEKSL